MLGTPPELDLLGEFWVDGSDQPASGTLALRVGRQPDLTLIGDIRSQQPRTVLLDSELPRFGQVRGRVIDPTTNRALEVVLVDAWCHRATGSLSGTLNVFWLRARLAVVAPELDHDSMFAGLDVSLRGYSEANRPPPVEVLSEGIEPVFRSELLGSVHGLSLSTALMTRVEHGSGRRSVLWEEVLRLELDTPVGYSEGPRHAAAVLSGYSVLSGKYVPVHRVGLFGTGSSERRWDGVAYGRLGLEWARGEESADDMGWRVGAEEDRKFLVNWLEFYFSASRTASDVLESLQFWRLAASGTPVDWAGLLVRLGVLTEALYGLQAEPIVRPPNEVVDKVRGEAEAKINEAISTHEAELTSEEVAYLGNYRLTWYAERRPTLVDKLRVLVAQLERHLELPLVSLNTIRDWKHLRTMSAHPVELSARRESAPTAIRQWTAVLNAWVLMHLGASSAAIRNVLGIAKLVQLGKRAADASVP